MLRKIKSWWALSLIHTVLPVALTFFLFVLSYCYILLPALETNLMNSKRQMIRELTSSVYHLLSQYELRYQKGELTLEEAQERARQRIRDMRYGSDSKDYFWITDTLGQMVMHPYRPDMEGKNMRDFRDAHGNDLFNDITEAVEDSGSGYVDYYWQWQDRPERIEPKISYAKYFAPWGWIVGTGIYLEDVDAQIDTITRPLKKTYLGILVLLVLLATYMITQSSKIENQRIVAIRKLRESEEKFRTIFNSLFNQIVLLDQDGHIIEMNQTGLNMIRKENQEIQGLPVYETELWNLSPINKDLLIHELEKSKSENLIRFQAQNKTADGNLIDVDVSIKALTNIFKQVQTVILESRDITEQKQAESDMKALIQQLEEQKGELEKFTYTVSHDLKSPLITIKGFLGLLESDIEQQDHAQLKLDITRIHDAVSKMEGLLRDLLELSRIGRVINVPEDVSFSDIVKDALDLVEGLLRGKNIKMVVHDSLPVVRGDSVRLRQVMVNLLSNASKFMGDQPHPIIEVGAASVDGETYIFVKDNGIGIEPEYQDRIFSLFEKLDQKSGGTGVGLSIVKRIIDVHGGRIWVESEGLGRGSTFCFSLPVKECKEV